jgi:hypothetical protein
MGTLSFLLPDPLSEASRFALERSGIAAGYERSPLPIQRTLNNQELTLRKDSSDSSYLLGVWPIQGLGEQLLMSATLRDRTEPYTLLTELARGRLNHLRCQISDWESIGYTLSTAQRDELQQVTKLFGQLVMEPTSPESGALADQLLSKTYLLSESVAGTFAQQLIHTRQLDQGTLTTLVGCRLTKIPPPEEQSAFLDTFNAVRLVPLWSELESVESEYAWQPFDDLVNWAIEKNLNVSIGPIIDLAQGPFPKWFEQWSGDLPSLAAFTCDYLETIIRRYRDRVNCWQVLTGFNQTDSLSLSEDDRLRLAARLLEAARQTERDAQWIIGLAQPWGDYLSSDEYTYSPIVFADTLQRAGFTFAAIELEVLSGPDRRASTPRDILEFYRLLELFNYMGIPLEVTLGDGTPNSLERLECRSQLAMSLPNVRGIYYEAWAKRDAIRVPNTEYFQKFESNWMSDLMGMTNLAKTRQID